MTKYVKWERYLRIIGVFAGLTFSLAARAHPHALDLQQEKLPSSYKWVQQQMQKRSEKASRKDNPTPFVFLLK